MKRTPCRLFAVLVMLAPLPLHAVETVKSPLVTEGLLEFENKGKLQHDANPARNDESEFDLNATYGFTHSWKSRIEGEFEQKRSSDLRYRSAVWENIVNLNGSDTQHQTVFGLYQNAALADRSDATHFFTLGAIARRDFSGFANTLNLFIRRDFGDTAKHGVSVQPRWQTKYALLPYFASGFEIIGDTQRRGAVRDWNLIIGPMVYGDVSFLGLTGVTYELGTLFGATPGSHDVTLKWEVKYGYAF